MLEKRQELPQLIERVLGEKPEREELDAFLTFFDITATGIIDSMEFGNGLRVGTRAPTPTVRSDSTRLRCLVLSPAAAHAPSRPSVVTPWC